MISSRVVVLCLVIVGLGGCASYQSHYGRFTAENSAGERRDFIVSWKSAEYPAWSLSDNEYTPVRLQSQCSERVWTLDEGQCGEGVTACGVPGQDLTRQGKPIGRNGHLCMQISDQGGADSISELDSPVLLTVSCYPENTEHQVDGEKENIDYLKASSVPYTVHIKTAPLYSMSARPPRLGEKVCITE